MTFKSTNPADCKLLETYEPHTPGQVNEIIKQSNQAFRHWQITTFSQRSELMQKAAQVLTENKEEYARLISLEMGKPISQSRAEVEKCSIVCSYYADNAEKFLENQKVATGYSESYVSFRPLGPVLAVMPWNFPFWQVFRFAAPALMAGNTALLKHASNVMGCALAIESVFIKAGFPEDVFRSLKIESKDVADVIEHPGVSAVTLTGSVGAGRAVAQKAGLMLKKTVLELGGSDPYIILEDADLQQAVKACVTSRLINGGQSCIAAKRFIVVESILEDFLSLFLEEMKKKKMSDPLEETTDIGPQASVALRDELHGQVTKSIGMGAQCLLGGYIPEKEGAWYPPTVLSGVKPGMPAWKEELFGPVAAIICASDQQHAISIANDSSFGLGAAVFTTDVEKGLKIAELELEAGCCFVNDFVKSDPRLPFGGIKNSGYGRELSSFGIREFVNIKTVALK